MFFKGFVLICMAVMPLQGAVKASNIAISFDQAQELGQKIWKNECGGKIEGLTSWNEGEDFASLGIGHFIWSPPKKDKVFQETFPDLLTFMESCGVTIPEWLDGKSGCPWRNRNHFIRNLQSDKMNALRTFLHETKALQAVYMAKRLELALPKLTQKLELAEKRRIEKHFNALCKTPKGIYALIDYLNFKGEGTSPQEKYKSKGWGLLQVLQGMEENSILPVDNFVKSAKKRLAERIKNAPQGRNEERWQKGWNSRLDTYLL